ncbi:MAG: PspC domain-containing protein [Bifidobacteriaceae bacterium]|jgi:phage shock protein PspC (stress-responsive transcriptional regulator)|nr:PspC domain-containing protein [Bifidobacteriaceae bacterium]
MAQSQPLPPREAGAAFFNWIRRHGLARGHDSWIAGVASGLARRLGWDANLVRGLFVIAAIFSGLGLLLYGAAWLAMARASDGRAELEDAIRGRFTAGFWGGAITGGVGLLYTVSWLPLGFPLSVFLLVAVGIGAGLVGARAASRPPAGPPWPGPASPPGRPTQTPPPMPSPVAAGAPTPVPAGAPATSPLAPPATGPLAPPPTGALPAPPDRADAAPPDRAAGGPLGGPTGQLGDATATKQLGAAGGPTEEPATMPLDTAATIAPGATATIPPGATATMAPGGPPTIPPGAEAAGANPKPPAAGRI